MTSEYSNSWHLFWKTNVKIKVILRRAYFLISLLCNVKFFIHFKPIKFSFYKSKCHSQNCRSNVFFCENIFPRSSLSPNFFNFPKKKNEKKICSRYISDFPTNLPQNFDKIFPHTTTATTKNYHISQIFQQIGKEKTSCEILISNFNCIW